MGSPVVAPLVLASVPVPVVPAVLGPVSVVGSPLEASSVIGSLAGLAQITGDAFGGKGGVKTTTIQNRSHTVTDAEGATAVYTYDELGRLSAVNDALDHTTLQEMRGKGHGQIGLTGASRADTENKVGLLDRTHICALGRRAGLDDTTARGDLRLAAGIAFGCLLPGVADVAVKIARTDGFAGGHALIKVLKHLAGDLGVGLRTRQDDLAVVHEIRVEGDGIAALREAGEEVHRALGPHERECRRHERVDAHRDDHGVRTLAGRVHDGASDVVGLRVEHDVRAPAGGEGASLGDGLAHDDRPGAQRTSEEEVHEAHRPRPDAGTANSTST